MIAEVGSVASGATREKVMPSSVPSHEPGRPPGVSKNLTAILRRIPRNRDGIHGLRRSVKRVTVGPFDTARGTFP